VIALVVLVAAWVFVTHAMFTSRYPGANDFYRNWAAARMWWTQGLSPYSPEVTAEIEMGMYGRRAAADQDPGFYSYPFYTVFFVTPLAFLPYAWAEAIWLTLLQIVLLASFAGTTRVVEWRMPPALFVFTSVWAILFYYGARAIILGQLAVIVYAFVVVVLLALRARRDVLAGVCLACATIKPQIVFLLVPLVILWAVARRRWRLVAGAGGAMLVLCGASFIALPSWLGDFIAELMRYPSYAPIGSPVWIVTRHYFPWLGAPTEIALTAALIVWMLISWWRLRRDDSWRVFVWVVGVTLVVTSLIAVRTATTNYLVLLVPLAQVLAAIQARWKRAGVWVIVGLEIVLLVGLWPLFLATLINKIEQPIMFLPLPIIVAVALAAWPRITSAAHRRVLTQQDEVSRG
jgi:hypothetical protein